MPLPPWQGWRRCTVCAVPAGRSTRPASGRRSRQRCRCASDTGWSAWWAGHRPTRPRGAARPAAGRRPCNSSAATSGGGWRRFPPLRAGSALPSLCGHPCRWRRGPAGRRVPGAGWKPRRRRQRASPCIPWAPPETGPFAAVPTRTVPYGRRDRAAWVNPPGPQRAAGRDSSGARRRWWRRDRGRGRQPGTGAAG